MQTRDSARCQDISDGHSPTTTLPCGNGWNTTRRSASAGAYSASISGCWQAVTGKETIRWQHSNNVWPTTDHFYALDVKTDEQMFEFITLIANGLWQGRKWRKAFKTLFEEYPELVRSSYEHELRGQPWKAYCAICKKYEELAQSKCNEIVARFRQLTGIV